MTTRPKPSNSLQGMATGGLTTMQRDTLITIDTIGNDLVLCPECGETHGLSVHELDSHNGRSHYQITCFNCRHIWNE